MTERSAIAVIRARLPYIAPETLSQAWFSAMRVARDRPVTQASRARSAISLPPPAPRLPQLARRPAPATSNDRQPPASAVSHRRGRADTTPSSEIAQVQRPARERSTVVRYRPPLPAAQTTFTIDVDGARVAFLVRCSGAQIGVIALCTPRYTQLVQRALARVATGMRAGGTDVDATVREVCSA